MPGASNKPSSSNDDFFNDLPRNDASGSENASVSPRERGNDAQNAVKEEYLRRPKRIACILCRKRKLKCDGEKPACGTCSRLGHDCAYDEVRKKSGPKRGYVKLLEQRLKQVENLLGSRDGMLSASAPAKQRQRPSEDLSDVVPMPLTQPSLDIFPNGGFSTTSMDPMLSDMAMGGTDDFSNAWELMELGLDESLPPQDTINDMNDIYFEKIHPSLPMIHRPRFLASMDLAPHMRPPVCLRYAMWTQVCSISSKYSALQEHFYARARKYAEADEMRGHGEGMITLAHAQAWTILAALEFKMMYFPRAWMSCGRATRLTQMMGLHRQDGFGLDVKQCLPPPRDWTEREERRRTFWMTFCQDRYASIGTGWPMTIDEQDILTNLPASEDAFNQSRPEQTISLADAMTGDGASTLSPFAGVVLMATLFGRNLTHLHRPTPEDRDHDLNGDFWKRHRKLDNILLNTSLSLPSHLRLPAGISCANIVFLNMNIHTSTICLHQAAIFKADKNRMAAQISAESKRRCIIAADQITNIMKMISHVDLSTMNPFLAFCLYVAARVFVQYLKSRKDDITVKSSLHFLLSAMQALKLKNPLTESFLVQLDVDLEGSGLDIPSIASKFESGQKKYPKEIPVNTDTVHCSPLCDIRESQVQGQNGPANNFQRPLRTTSDMPMDFSASDFSDLGYFTRNVSSSSMPQRIRSTLQENSNAQFSISSLTESDPSPGASGSSDNQWSSRPHSGHPTPAASSSSNKGSSNTSFTPPQFSDAAGYAAFTMSTGMSPNTTSRAFEPFVERTEPRKDGPAGIPTPFAMSASWDYSADGPPSTGTGLKEQNHDDMPSDTGLTPGSGMTPFMSSDGGFHSINANMNADGHGNGLRMEGADWMFTTGWGSGTTPAASGPP